MTSTYAQISTAYRLRLATSGMMLVASLMGLAGCAGGEGGGPSPQAAMAEEIVSVNTEVVKVGTFEAGLTLTGTTQPVQTVALRSRVAGQVTALTVDVGDAVGNGDVLARQDADLLTVVVNQAQAELQARQSEVAQAQAAVSDAQTAYNSAQVRLQQAQTEADRLTPARCRWGRLPSNGGTSTANCRYRAAGIAIHPGANSHSSGGRWCR